MPSELQTQTYKSIMQTYDTMESMIMGLQKFGVQSDPYVKHLQKMIDVIEKNNENILNNFFKYVESGKTLSGVEKLKIENALKDIKIAIQQFLNKIDN